jgi:hypothetical protein
MTGGEIDAVLLLLLLELELDHPKISPNPFLVFGFFCNLLLSLSCLGGDALLAKKAGTAADFNDRLNVGTGVVVVSSM